MPAYSRAAISFPAVRISSNTSRPCSVSDTSEVSVSASSLRAVISVTVSSATDSSIFSLPVSRATSRSRSTVPPWSETARRATDWLKLLPMRASAASRAARLA